MYSSTVDVFTSDKSQVSSEAGRFLSLATELSDDNRQVEKYKEIAFNGQKGLKD